VCRVNCDVEANRRHDASRQPAERAFPNVITLNAILYRRDDDARGGTRGEGEEDCLPVEHEALRVSLLAQIFYPLKDISEGQAPPELGHYSLISN
jgi:hypothetical protein